MKIAYWNINTGESSFVDRKDTLSEWCKEMDLDLLFLEEVSHKLANSIETMTGLEETDYVNTRDKNFAPSTKQIWALKRRELDFQGTALRLQGLDSIRMGMKVTSSGPNVPEHFAMWGLHANASPSGGKAAVKYSDDYLKNYSHVLIGGDFNFPYLKLNLQNSQACPPLSWQGDIMNFTQWNKEDGLLVKPDPKLHLKTMDTGHLKIIPSSNGIIDFVIYGNGLKVQALPNCLSEVRWVNILKNFDHCPVVYNLNL